MRNWLVILTLFLFACAQQVSPTGGPVDTNPPVEIQAKTLPQNFSTEFKAPRIEIHFDEYITLKNKNQIITSPRMDSPPVINVKGKKIIIDLKSTLEDNTTYSINFGNSIQDITNNNVLANYRYVLSTGAFLDSLEYAGYVYDAFSGEPKEGATVMLYTVADDSAAWKKKPTYFMKTSKSGRFHLKNLKQGNYQVVALIDKNNNYTYDASENELGFKSNSVVIAPDSSSQPVEDIIYVFQDKPEKQYIESYRYEPPGKFILKFNQKLIAPSLYFENQNQSGTIYLGKKRDSAYIFLNELYQDTVLIKIEDPALKATIKYKPKEVAKTGIKLSYQTNMPVAKLNPFEPLELTFARPLNNIHQKAILLVKDSVEINYSLTRDSSDSRKIYINHKFKPEEKYQLKFLPKAAEDIYGFYTDTSTLDFTVAKEENYGAISLKLIALDNSRNYILTLSQGENVVFYQYIEQKTSFNAEIKGLSAGKYDLMIIEDLDENRIWSTGNYSLKKQPEPIFRWQGGIQLKPNWIQEIEWEPLKKD
ncbi:MAG: Ig-like domain-containing protein [Flavobacteriales bacterium]